MEATVSSVKHMSVLRKNATTVSKLIKHPWVQQLVANPYVFFRAHLFFLTMNREQHLLDLIDERQFVRGLEMDAAFVLLDFINAYEGDFAEFARAYEPVLKEAGNGEDLSTLVRACLCYFIEFPDVVYMA